jgi:hypothetical protein
MLTPEGLEKAQAELDERYAKIDAEVAKCPYCKRAQMKENRRATYASQKPRKVNCKKHREVPVQLSINLLK